jgi:hypothetical protein
VEIEQMPSYESTFKINQEPVLPLFCQTQPIRTRISTVRTKVQSFRIAPNHKSQTDCQLSTSQAPLLSEERADSISSFKKDRESFLSSKELSLTHQNIDLPSFIHSKTFVAMNCVKVIPQAVIERQINNQLEQNQFVQTSPAKRFWWQWLLLGIGAILILPNNSDAQDFLSKAKIYLNLDSAMVTNIPKSGKSYLQSSQASDFQKAIQTAQQVEPDSPFFPEAQAEIVRWSRVILDIAQGRASQGDFVSAIAAAKLVPQEISTIEPVAQEAKAAISQWQLQENVKNSNQNLIEVAKTLIQPTQASSYNLAIAVLRQIPCDNRDYQTAQELIRKWSKQIYLIAHSRAAREDFQGAIAAAVLVPKDAADYQKATEAIFDWKESLSIEF